MGLVLWTFFGFRVLYFLGLSGYCPSIPLRCEPIGLRAWHSRTVSANQDLSRILCTAEGLYSKDSISSTAPAKAIYRTQKSLDGGMPGQVHRFLLFEPNQLRGGIIPAIDMNISRLSKTFMLRCGKLINVSNEFLQANINSQGECWHHQSARFSCRCPARPSLATGNPTPMRTEFFNTVPCTHEVKRNEMGYDKYYSGTRYTNMQGPV